jgi:hypothetical protein
MTDNPTPPAAETRPKNPYDGPVKRAFHLSRRAVNATLSHLFGIPLSDDTPVDYLETEQHPGGSPRHTDLNLQAAGYWFHLEAEHDRHGSMALRMWIYDAHIAASRADLDRGRHTTTIDFPRSRVIYLTGGTRTPDVEFIRLRFHEPAFTFDLPVRSIALAKYDVAELEQHGLYVLMPFAVLRRQRAIAQGTHQRRARAAAELTQIQLDLAAAYQRAVEAGKITPEDQATLIEITTDLVHWAYVIKYNEFKEATTMETLYKTRAQIAREQAHQEGLQEGREEGRQGLINVARRMLADGLAVDDIARYTGLTTDQINDLAAA